MKEFINEYIKDLSIKDKKTLSQKTLKLVEEVGELAKVILPYDSASGTNHRFANREAILEEIIDVYLTNISIAHSLNFSDDEINEMLGRKSRKWAELQINEAEITFPLPFEIHVTVDASDVDIDTFKTKCESLSVKPIVLDLELNDSVIKDVMTSSKHFGDNRSAYDESMRIVSELIDAGYKVVRNKIETVPWHMKAPTTLDKMEVADGCYFESHIGVLIEHNEKERLNILVNSINHLSGTARLSRNFFKKSKYNGSFINMLTYRSNKCGSIQFKEEVEYIKNLLVNNNFSFEKVEIEFAIYDTNIMHDSKWIIG